MGLAVGELVNEGDGDSVGVAEGVTGGESVGVGVVVDVALGV